MDGKLTGVYARGNSIQIKFQYKGIRCAETLGIPPNKANLKYASNLRSEILRKIELGIFKYADYFPDSKKVKLYSTAIPLTVKQELLNYLESQRDEEIEHSTWNHYRKIIDTYLIPSLGDFLVSDITASQIKIWRSELNVSNKTKNNILVPLRRMFSEAYYDEKIDKNPLDRVKNLKLDTKEANPFTPEEIIKILSSFDGQRRNLFQFAFSTGLRPSEYIALEWGDIDWDKELVNVRRAYVANRLKRTKTEAGKRFVKLRPSAFYSLQAQKEYTAELNQHVFHNPNNNKPWKSDGDVRKTWLYGLKRAGVEYRNPYQTRHTFASMMLTLGEEPFRVMTEMGHKTLHELESTYARWIQGISNPENKTFISVWSQICHEVYQSD